MSVLGEEYERAFRKKLFRLYAIMIAMGLGGALALWWIFIAVLDELQARGVLG